MKRAIFLLTILLVAACGKEAINPDCKTCTVQQVIYVNEEEMDAQPVVPAEFCGEALAEIEANPRVAVTRQVGADRQDIVSIYQCPE